jgi:Carboxypeptidase regulatory-like domain
VIEAGRAYIVRSLPALLVFALSTFALAASLSLRGSVTDPAGAAVGKAEISLTAIETGLVQHATTNDAGEFGFSDLAPGKYRLFVSAPGFKVAIQEVTLGVGGTESIRVTLPVGVTEEVVEVSSQPPVVYNAIFSPVYPGTADQIYDKQEVTVRFFIGPPDQKNGLSPQNWAVNPKILRVKGMLPLSVTANCVPCARDSVQTQPITYTGKTLRSSEAIFKFVPSRNLASKEGVGQLIFSIATNGLELDRFVASIFIGQRSKEVVFHNSHVFSSELPEAEGADLTLILSGDPTGGLSVQLDPSNPDLLSRFRGRHLSAGHLRPFSIAINQNDLQVSTFKTYVQLRSIIDQYDKPLQQALSGGPGAGVVLSSSAAIQFNPEDYKKVLNLFGDVGTTLYRRLFVDDAVDPNLRDLMAEFKNFDIPGKTVHVRISAKNLYFPWQLLHPPGNSDEKLFWGIRYVLTVDSLGRRSEGPLPGSLHMDKNSNQVFAAYRGDPGSPPDEVSELASQQLSHYKQKFSDNVHLAQSNDELMQLLKLSGTSVTTILAYTHGTSGVEFQTLPNGAVTAAVDIRGPRLLFANNNYITPSNIESLMNDLDETHPTLFDASPLIFLNACETGAAGMAPLYGPSFPDTLLRMGARGVIATESPVWAYFAYHFGNDLIDELSMGVTAPEALFETRIKYLTLKNPLGLLYSYYGAPDVRIESSN